MIAESSSRTLNLKERLWQYILIDWLVRADAVDSFKLNIRYMTRSDKITQLESQAWYINQISDLKEDTIIYYPVTKKD